MWIPKYIKIMINLNKKAKWFAFLFLSARRWALHKSKSKINYLFLFLKSFFNNLIAYFFLISFYKKPTCAGRARTPRPEFRRNTQFRSFFSLKFGYYANKKNPKTYWLLPLFMIYLIYQRKRGEKYEKIFLGRRWLYYINWANHRTDYRGLLVSACANTLPHMQYRLHCSHFRSKSTSRW